MNVKPYTKKDFQWTQWTAKDIKKLIPKILEHKKRCYAEIKKIPKDKRAFKNTISAALLVDMPPIDSCSP